MVLRQYTPGILFSGRRENLRHLEDAWLRLSRKVQRMIAAETRCSEQ